MKLRRRRAQLTAHDVDLHAIIMLQVGANDEEILAEGLREIWEAIGHELMPSPTCPDGMGDTDDDAYRNPPGTRPWAFWHFNLGREMPEELEQLDVLKSLGLFLGSWEEAAGERYRTFRRKQQAKAWGEVITE